MAELTKKEEILSIPSMSSEIMKEIEFLLEQSCAIINEIQSENLDKEKKKEILQMAEDKTSGIERGIVALTQLNDATNTFELLQEMFIEKISQKLSVVSKKLLEFEKDETKRNELEQEIITAQSCHVPVLNDNHIKKLEEWTGLYCSELVFDSEVDNWSKNTSVFDKRIIGKKQLIFLIEDTDGELFGYYLNTEVFEKYWGYVETDSKSIHFNFKFH